MTLLGGDDDEDNQADVLGAPRAFELEYLIEPLRDTPDEAPFYAHVRIDKLPGHFPRMHWLNAGAFGELAETLTSDGLCGEEQREFLLPANVLGYSSGENEILSLPFFKMRFVKLDEYLAALRRQNTYTNTRLTYLDKSFSQAILLCNLLLQDEETLTPFRDVIGIGELKEFRIVLRRHITLTAEQVMDFADDESQTGQKPEVIVENNPALSVSFDEASNMQHYQLNVLYLLEGDNAASPTIDALKRCATLYYEDEADDTLTLDYYINAATRAAFRVNFGDAPLALFQALQVLLTFNLYAVSDQLKDELYQSDSQYVTETVPVLASDQRIMRFKNFWFTKQGLEKPVLLKSLSDGEHQLLHSLGLCLLFRGSNSLFLLDEPGTHFNPRWRASFVRLLCQCLDASPKSNEARPPRPEMLLTTHSPFPISDSVPRKVLVFKKDEETGTVSVSHPEYNTLGASINKITMTTFRQRSTIGGMAQAQLEALRQRFEAGEDADALVDELERTLGDSVEKILLINAMLAGRESSDTDTDTDTQG